MWLESRPFPRWPVARGAQLGGVDGFDRPVSCNVLNPFQAFGSGDAWCLNGGGVWGAAPVSFGVSCRVYDSLEILGGSAETLGRLQSSGRRSCKVRRGTGSLEGPEERCDEVPNHHHHQHDVSPFALRLYTLFPHSSLRWEPGDWRTMDLRGGEDPRD